ncbi:MAG: kinase, partial [Phycisphaerae bacterium]
LLHEAWVEKRGLHSVISNSVIDESYEKARAAGAIGGKLLGAGSGGFVLLFVPPERHAAVRQALAGSPMLCPRSGGLASQVIFNDTQMRQPAGVLLHVAD